MIMVVMMVIITTAPLKEINTYGEHNNDGDNDGEYCHTISKKNFLKYWAAFHYKHFEAE